jgi:hypothetical protein
MSQHVDNPEENDPESAEAESELAEAEEESALNAQGRPVVRPSAKKHAPDGRTVKPKPFGPAPGSTEAGTSDAVRVRRVAGPLASEVATGIEELVAEQKSHLEYLKKGGKSGITTDFLKVTIEDGSTGRATGSGETRATHPQDAHDIHAGERQPDMGGPMQAVQHVLDAVQPSKIEQAASFLQRSLETLNVPDSQRVAAGVARPAEVVENRPPLTRQEQIQEALAAALSEQIIMLDRECRARYGAGILESIDDPALIAQATRSALERCIGGREENSQEGVPPLAESKAAAESRDRFAQAIAEACAGFIELPVREQTERLERIGQQLEALGRSGLASTDSLIEAMLEAFSPRQGSLTNDTGLFSVVGATIGANALNLAWESSPREEDGWLESGLWAAALARSVMGMADYGRPAEPETGLKIAEKIAAAAAAGILAQARASWLKEGAEDLLRQELSRVVVSAVMSGARLIDEAALLSLSEKVAAEGRDKVIERLLKEVLTSAIEAEAKQRLRACIAGLIEELPETQRGEARGEPLRSAAGAAPAVLVPADQSVKPEKPRETARRDDDSAGKAEKNTRRRRTQETDVSAQKKDPDVWKETQERPVVGSLRCDDEDKNVQRAQARERVRTERDENVREQLMAAMAADAARAPKEKPQEHEDDRTKNPLDVVPGVSHHAVLLLGKDGRIYLKDMSSTGTWVNGRRIPFNQPTPITPADAIRLGSKSGPELKLTKRGGRATRSDVRPPSGQA